ncbi:MAG: AMP-binding protein [Longimicrobiales bacterium]
MPRNDSSLANLLARATASSPGAPAIVTRDRVTSWRQLLERAGAFARAIEAAGTAPGDRVALYLEPDADTAAAIFGIYAARAVAVIINPRFRARQIEYILSDADAAVLVTTPELLARQPRKLETRAQLLDASTIPEAEELEVRPVDAAALAQIIYTSGSTGYPKGVMFTTGALRSGVATVRDYLGLRADDRVAGILSFSGVYGLNQLLTAVASEATLVVESSPLAVEIVGRLRASQVTVLAAVPPLWLQLLAVPEFVEPFPSLRLVQSAGGRLPVGAVKRLRTLQPQADLFLQYGMTETFRSTFLPPAEVAAHPDSMGRGIPGAEILVVRPDDRLCEVGEVGELVHAGPTLASGYWRAPDASARVFRPHPTRAGARAVYSGDLVRSDAEGRLYYVSRRDHVIKTLGFRVGPDEVTDVLHASGQVVEAVVVPEPDAERGQRIIAVVVLAPDGSVETLRRFCREELPPYMQPARFDVVASLPRLPSGKYNVDALGRART